MKIIERLLTKNRCYQKGEKITVKGLMLHSIGCPQPSAEILIKSWNSATTGTCVHAFIDGNSGDVYQTLPWNYRAWHCGSGSRGSGNDTFISVEMCEPACIKYTCGANFTCSDVAAAKAVTKRTYETAVELFAMLCEKYSLDPLADGVVLSHREGHARGIASNHGDPEHLWTQLGMEYTMDGFRKAVKAAMDRGNVSANIDERKIWNKLKSFGLNDYAAAGIMGNWFAESSLKPNNLQNTFNSKLNMTDEEYTSAVDNGSYSNFIDDKAGYGFCQWTFWSRKQALLEYAQEKNVSIADPDMQMEFFWQEIQGYRKVMDVLKGAVSVLEASNAILHGYEQPADQSEAVQRKRAEYGQAYFDEYAVQAVMVDLPYQVRVKIPDLNIRKEPGINGKKTGKYTGIGTFTIVEEADGQMNSSGKMGRWGLLKSYQKNRDGWICLSFAEKI